MSCANGVLFILYNTPKLNDNKYVRTMYPMPPAKEHTQNKCEATYRRNCCIQGSQGRYHPTLESNDCECQRLRPTLLVFFFRGNLSVRLLYCPHPISQLPHDIMAGESYARMIGLIINLTQFKEFWQKSKITQIILCNLWSSEYTKVINQIFTQL